MSLVNGLPPLRQFGEFTLDLRAAELRRQGRKVRLQEQPFQILAMLLDRPGEVVTREEVQQRLWPADTFVDFDHGLNNAVARLREALRDSAEAPKYVETVARRGYRFIAPVESIELAPSSVTAVDPPSVASPATPLATRRRWQRGPTLAAITAVAVAVTALVSLRTTRPVPGAATAARDPARIHRERPVAPATFDLYLRARYHLGRQDEADIDQAIDLLQRAAALDPQFALAHAELARAYRLKSFLFAPQQKELEEKAFVAVEKALSIDPDLPEAHLARGRTLWTLPHRFPHDPVIEEYWRALAEDPGLDEAHYELGHVYNHVGLLEEGLSELRKAAALNPSNTQARFRIGINLAYQGKDQEALDALQAIPRSTNPSIWGFQTASALLRLGRRDEARALLTELANESPRDEGGVRTSVEAILLAQGGAHAEAVEKIQTAVSIGRGFGHFHHTAYNVASAYALMDDGEGAQKWLEVAADEGFPCYPLYAKDPNLNSMRARPAFVELLSRLRRDWQRRREHAHEPRPGTE
jgi:DNA-binding winged helix-turn-helix (wHTH) protein/Tfp pilus assembly protein PilF